MEEETVVTEIPSLRTGLCWLSQADAMDCYASWPSPACIVSDGAYGIGGFDGDPSDVGGLEAWYRPHVARWSEASSTATTLWFWNTEIGWATVHPLLERNGWKYVRCCVWDKGKSHLAGNINTRTLRQFPCVTEVCVQYVRDRMPSGQRVQDWLRAEWRRSGLPLKDANRACGTRSAATRKYLSADGAFYPPPEEMMERLREFANANGDPSGRPYFAMPEGRFQPKFDCPFGMTNVWRCRQVFSGERVRDAEGRPLHPNQKPLQLMEAIVRCCTDPGEAVWEPFGGVFTASAAAALLGRRAFGAETCARYYEAGAARIAGLAGKEDGRLF